MEPGRAFTAIRCGRRLGALTGHRLLVENRSVSRQKAAYRTSRQAAKTALGNAGFIPHSRELRVSDAWRTRPINVARFIEFLEMEHLKHSGRENGSLHAPYDELVRYGI